jgi:class 3 adenylate cyclase
MKKTSIRFKYEDNDQKHGFVMVFDLEGFTQFVNQPGVDDYHLTEYLNVVFKSVDVCLLGGTPSWADYDEKIWVPFSQVEKYSKPSHVKFMGDGALYLWTRPFNNSDFKLEFILLLMNRLATLREDFENVVRLCSDEIQSFNVPERIRFGFARGTVYELSGQRLAEKSQKEYVGSCINLASRLQNYCPELGFIASARLAIPKSVLDEHGYMVVSAKKIRGFQREKVIVIREEYESLPKKTKTELFMDVAG